MTSSGHEAGCGEQHGSDEPCGPRGGATRRAIALLRDGVILSEPRENARVVRRARAGEQLRLLAYSGEFAEVDLGLRGRGFIDAGSVEEVAIAVRPGAPPPERREVPAASGAPVPAPGPAADAAWAEALAPVAPGVMPSVLWSDDAFAGAEAAPAPAREPAPPPIVPVEPTPSAGTTPVPAPGVDSAMPGRGMVAATGARAAEARRAIMDRLHTTSVRDDVARLGAQLERWLTAARLAELVAVAGVFAVAVVVRVVRLGTVPHVITGDETDNLQVAYHIISGNGPGIFGFDWKPAPIFSLYPMAWTIRLFGHSVSDFRMFPVLLSLVTLAAFYIVARQAMRAWAAVPALLLMATNLWVLHFSRTAWENINAALFALGACFTVSRGLQTGRMRWWVLAGVFVACGLYGYFSGRFIFVAVGAATFLAIGLRLTPWRPALRGLAVAALVSAVLFAPMAKRIYDRWDYFNQRTKDISVFQNRDPYEGDTDGWVIAWKNVGRNFRGLVLQDGAEFGRGLWARYNPPQRAPLDGWLTPLLLGGLVVGAFRWRTTYVWWTFFVPLFIAEVFSKGTPDLARAMVFAPFYFLFIGLLFEEIFRRRSSPLGQGVAVAAVAALVAFPSVSNVQDYFDWQDNPSVQNARLPGVDACEFPTWRALALSAADGGTGNLNPDVFATQRKQLRCSPVVNDWLDGQAPTAASAGGSPAERDARRREDLASIRRALAAYSTEHGAYPGTTGNVQSLCAYKELDAGCKLSEVLNPIPADPLRHGYWYRSDGREYALYAVLEAGLGGCPDVPADFFTEPGNVYCETSAPP